MIDQDILDRHVGRETRAKDFVDPERMQRLAGLLDHEWSPGDQLPPLAHFVLFRPDAVQSRLGEDGHPLREPGSMLPDIPLPRRMWAGSRIRFAAPLEPGMPVRRASRLAKAVAKSGSSGDLVFCTVQHEIRSIDRDEILIEEEQDLVYRGAHEGGGLASRPAIAPEFEPEENRFVSADPVMLFRYSALTYNSHRIHYDREYAREVEGYQGLVVHGPLLATLLFDHLERLAGPRRIESFAFRAMSPSFDDEELALGASLDGDTARLSITNSVGLALSGRAGLVAGA